jgi:hypothetical protein
MLRVHFIGNELFFYLYANNGLKITQTVVKKFGFTKFLKKIIQAFKKLLSPLLAAI